MSKWQVVLAKLSIATPTTSDGEAPAELTVEMVATTEVIVGLIQTIIIVFNFF